MRWGQTVNERRTAARAAQRLWRRRPLSVRLAVLASLRRAIAADPQAVAAAVDRSEAAVTLSAEVLPLLDAAQFCERAAPQLLAPESPGRRSRPGWLRGVDLTVHREPLGLILVIGPANYPLFLPGVQALQALAAGNGVLVKPAPGQAAPMEALGRLLADAGLPAGLFQVLPDGAEAARAAIAAGVDHVLFTGSSHNGRAVHEWCAAHATPVTLECSGSDAVFVLPGADPGLAARSIAYGLRLNGSNTCIAPRRCIVVGEAAAFHRALESERQGLPPVALPLRTVQQLERLLDGARAAGAVVHGGGCDTHGRWRPTVVTGATPDLELCNSDVAAPVVAVIAAATINEALCHDAACAYALGASVFGPDEAAVQLAGEIDAGVVVINDMIVPTADPRLPFAGRGRSGHGVTRGAAGLLALTRTKAVTRRRGRFRPHLDPSLPGDGRLFTNWIRWAHGGGFRAALDLMRALPARARLTQAEEALV